MPVAGFGRASPGDLRAVVAGEPVTIEEFGESDYRFLKALDHVDRSRRHAIAEARRAADGFRAAGASRALVLAEVEAFLVKYGGGK